MCLRAPQATPLWDRLVFAKLKARLGGRVRLIVSGGAPLAPHTEEFLKVTMCAPVVQGYGLTETCAGSFISVPGLHVRAPSMLVCTPGTSPFACMHAWCCGTSMKAPFPITLIGESVTDE